MRRGNLLLQPERIARIERIVTSEFVWLISVTDVRINTQELIGRRIVVAVKYNLRESSSGSQIPLPHALLSRVVLRMYLLKLGH